MDSTDNAQTESKRILVDQAILVLIQNENKTLHKLVIEYQLRVMHKYLVKLLGIQVSCL